MLSRWVILEKRQSRGNAQYENICKDFMEQEKSRKTVFWMRKRIKISEEELCKQAKKRGNHVSF